MTAPASRTFDRFMANLQCSSIPEESANAAGSFQLFRGLLTNLLDSGAGAEGSANDQIHCIACGTGDCKAIRTGRFFHDDVSAFRAKCAVGLDALSVNQFMNTALAESCRCRCQACDGFVV